MFTVGFFISGKGRLFRAAAAVGESLGFRPAYVILEESASPDIEDFCKSKGIPAVRFSPANRQVFDREIAGYALEAGADAIALTFNRIVPRELVVQYEGRMINVHMSLLPAFRGFQAISRALEAGVRWIGATIHFVSAEVDGGPIITQCQIPAHPELTVDKAGRRLYPLLEQSYVQTLTWMAAGRLELRPNGKVHVADARYKRASVLPCPEEPVLCALASLSKSSLERDE